jgi:hypothetical protein
MHLPNAPDYDANEAWAEFLELAADARARHEEREEALIDSARDAARDIVIAELEAFARDWRPEFVLPAYLAPHVETFAQMSDAGIDRLCRELAIPCTCVQLLTSIDTSTCVFHRPRGSR